MPTLDELLSLPGVYGALEFACTGELGDLRGDVNRDFAELVAQMCAANMAIYRMQASGWTKLTGQSGFLPERGFAFVALEHVVMGMDGRAVLARAGHFDYDAAYQRMGAA